VYGERNKKRRKQCYASRNREAAPEARAMKYAHVAQSAEHFLGKEEVMGPIPIVGFAQ
jgi:hypothetical protein